MIDGLEIDSIDSPVLADGDRWARMVAIAPARAGDDQRVDFVLYNGDANEPYRSLHLWLTVEPEVVNTIPPPKPGSAKPVALSEAAPSSDQNAPPPEPTPPPAEPPPAEPRTVHVVVAGENLTLIARHYSLTLSALLALNDIEKPSLIYPNQRINLPPPGSEQESQ